MVSGWWSSVMCGGGRRRCGVELRDLAAPEVAVRELGVRNDELRVAQLAVAEAHNVEIESPRSPAYPPLPLPLPASLLLDRAQLAEQFGRRERGLEQHHLVQVWSLRHGSERRRLFDAGGGDDARAGQRGEARPGVREMGLPIPDVRSQRHVYPLARPHRGMVNALRDRRKAAGEISQ